MFNSFEEFFLYKKENPINKSLKQDVSYLLSLKNFSGIYELDFLGNKFKYLNIGNDDLGILKFFWGGEPEFVSVRFWIEACQMDGLSIDVGAHTGRYTVIGSIYSKKNNIVSFEPYYLNYARMLSNLRLNNILTNNCFFSAASSKNGSASFTLNTKHNYFHTSAGKINFKKEEKMKVPIVKIDSFNFKNKINAIKIDTEGHELEVVKGAIKIIENQKPLLIIEKNNENFISIINLLINFDYYIYIIDDSNFKIKILDLTKKNFLNQDFKNFICIPKNNFNKFEHIIQYYIIN